MIHTIQLYTNISFNEKDKIEKRFIVEMESKQLEIYNRYLKRAQKELVNENNQITILSILTKLRQICIDPSLVSNDYSEISCKYKMAIDISRECIKSKEKVLIFSQFTSVLKKFGGILSENNISYIYLDGNSSAKARIELVQQFNEGNTYIFLISLKAGGTGLNLTSASKVIHFDLWWNPAVEDQAADRAYRMGQKQNVEVIKLIAKNSIEENIILLQEEKKQLISEIIDENYYDKNKVNTISIDEINCILGMKKATEYK